MLVAIVATDARYLEEQALGPEDIAGVIPMGCRLNDYVEITDTPPPRYETSWVPAARINDFMKREVAFVSFEQRNAAVPAAHVSERLPPTLVLIADAERSFPPILLTCSPEIGAVGVRDWAGGGADAEEPIQ